MLNTLNQPLSSSNHRELRANNESGVPRHAGGLVQESERDSNRDSLPSRRRVTGFRAVFLVPGALGKSARAAPWRAFREPQLPLRGVVDESFVTKCLEHIPDGSEYVLAETVRRVYGRHSFFHCGSGESHAELRDDLEESCGAPVAVGLYPPVLEESVDVIRAVVPDADGVVRAGPY